MSDQKWVRMDDALPVEGQDVWYFFEPFEKVYDGKYIGLCDKGILHGFGGPRGFNFGPEVQWWMPRADGDVKPEMPKGEWK